MENHRELDQLVAKKVMQWGRVPLEPPLSHLWLYSDDKGHTWMASEAPPFSSDIKVAWLVVEKMQERGFEMVLDNVRQWHCAFFCDGAVPVTGSGLASLAPLAICLSALNAVDLLSQ